jgi:hypothetical protein
MADFAGTKQIKVPRKFWGHTEARGIPCDTVATVTLEFLAVGSRPARRRGASGSTVQRLGRAAVAGLSLGCCSATGDRTIKHYFSGMKPLPSIYSVRRIGDRWWIEAHSEHPHRRELDCRLLRSSCYLSSESREDRVRDRVDRGFPQETVPFPPGNGHRFPQATVIRLATAKSP